MESSTFIDQDVITELNENFVAAKLFTYGHKDEREEDINEALFKSYYPGDKAAPSFAITKPDGTLIHRFAGKLPAKEFMEKLKQGKAKSTRK